MRLMVGAILGLTLAGCTAPTEVTDTNERVETTIPAEAESDTAFTGPVTVFAAERIYTGNPAQPIANRVVIGADQRILAVLPETNEDVIETRGGQVSLIDLGDAVMFPGFVDGHAHLRGIGQRELTLNLEGTASIAELVTRIETELQNYRPNEVLIGRGWIETGWPEERMPVADDFDAISMRIPVILVRADGHALVANTAALAAAGITDETPDVEGGKIERDADGRATGILIDNAMAPVLALLAAPTKDEIVRAYQVGAQAYASRGWTGIHNMSVDPVDAPLLAAIDQSNELPLRLHNAFDEAGFEIAESRTHETDTITNRAVKVYMDGALGSRGALLIEPYSDRPDTSGLALMQQDQLSTLMARAKDADVQLAIHAIGDLANRRILDAFDAGGYGVNHRWRIEHTQVLHPDDIARVGALGLIASMQPSHAIGDLKFAPDRLGVDRLYGAYAWQSLLDTNATIVGGSDAPVEIGTPQIEFYAAVARKDLEGFSTANWYPDEALSREQALALFTSAPAYAAFMEDDLGTIEVGKLADFTVFDRDLMTVPEAEILAAETVMTVVQGEIVFSKD